jgi:threonine synthase
MGCQSLGPHVLSVGELGSYEIIVATSGDIDVAMYTYAEVYNLPTAR